MTSWPPNKIKELMSRERIEIENAITKDFPEAKVENCLYDYDYHKSIMIFLDDARHLFIKEVPFKISEKEAENFEEDLRYEGYRTKEPYPAKFLACIAEVLSNIRYAKSGNHKHVINI